MSGSALCGISFLMGPSTKCLFVGCICVCAYMCNNEFCCFKRIPRDGCFGLFCILVNQKKSLESTTNKCLREHIRSTKLGVSERQKVSVGEAKSICWWSQPEILPLLLWRAEHMKLAHVPRPQANCRAVPCWEWAPVLQMLKEGCRKGLTDLTSASHSLKYLKCHP